MRKVDITFSFAALICFLGWLDMELCVCFVAALLVHELGHLLAMKLGGVPVRSFRLSAGGAVICGEFSGYRQEIACAVFGPVFSAVLAIICARQMPKLSVLSAVLGLVNLLPVYPLDGGRILRGILLLHFEQGRAETILNRTTAAVCCLLMVAACWVTVELQAGLWPIFAVLVILCRVGQAQVSEGY